MKKTPVNDIQSNVYHPKNKTTQKRQRRVRVNGQLPDKLDALLTRSSDALSKAQTDQLSTVLHKHKMAFREEGGPPGYTDVIKHDKKCHVDFHWVRYPDPYKWKISGSATLDTADRVKWGGVTVNKLRAKSHSQYHVF